MWIVTQSFILFKDLCHIGTMSKQSSLSIAWTWFKVNAVGMAKTNYAVCKASTSRGGKDFEIAKYLVAF